MRIVILFVLTTIISSCTTTHQRNEYDILKDECRNLTDVDNNQICQIINSEKELYTLPAMTDFPSESGPQRDGSHDL